MRFTIPGVGPLHATGLIGIGIYLLGMATALYAIVGDPAANDAFLYGGTALLLVGSLFLGHAIVDRQRQRGIASS